MYHSKTSDTRIGQGRENGIIYNGDIDVICNFMSGEWFVDDLGLPLLDYYKEWQLNQQVAGYIKKFENLTFATIKGAGHMAAADKPAEALFSQYLNSR